MNTLEREEYRSEDAARDGVWLRWEPATRLILMHFTSELPGANLTADDARWALDRVKEWTGYGAGLPYGALVDCRGLENADAGWRATLNDYYRSLPRGTVAVAWYNLRPLVRIMAEMFAAVSRGIDGKTFRTELEARAWLRRRGFG